MKHEHDLTGWDITHGADTEWAAWGGDGAPARAKVLGTGDGYSLVLVHAGYSDSPHEHDNAEFSYVISGTVEHQGVPMQAGDGYVASAVSVLNQRRCRWVFDEHSGVDLLGGMEFPCGPGHEGWCRRCRPRCRWHPR